MNHLNTVLIEGNLTRDPKEVGGNTANPGCRFYIANNRYRLKNGGWEKETTFFPVLVFGRIGEACARNLKRGRGVRVCGRLKQDFTKSGTTDTTYILAEHVEFQPERTTAPEANTGVQSNPAPQSNLAGSQMPQGQTQNQGLMQGQMSQTQAQGQPQTDGSQYQGTQWRNTSQGNDPAYGQGYRQQDAPQTETCIGNSLLANATNGTNSANSAEEETQGPEAFDNQNSQDWDSSVPENVRATAEANLENLGKGVSAEEISEIDNSEEDYNKAENSDEQLEDCEPEY